MSKTSFATCDVDENQVTFWDIDQDKPIKSFSTSSLITSIQFDPSGTYLAISSAEQILLYSIDSDSPRVF